MGLGLGRHPGLECPPGLTCWSLGAGEFAGLGFLARSLV